MSSISRSPISGQPHHIIKSSLVTEKTTHMVDRHNVFVLEVSHASSKPEIRRAVEDAWGVRVISVRTQTRVGKSRRHKTIVAVSRQKKLAYIQLHTDDRLNFL